MTARTHLAQGEINIFHSARKGTEQEIVLEGLHAWKHAYRFGAEMIATYVYDKERACRDMRRFAGDAASDALEKCAMEISQASFDMLASQEVRTGIIARARKGATTCSTVTRDGAIVALENPRDLGNIGAVIRVAAARGAAAVIVTGNVSPWHVNVLRGAAGLHFAQPVVHRENIAELQKIFPERPLIVCSDEGENMYRAKLPRNSIFVFGTEREGVTPQTKERATQVVGIPMQKGVSSMNLATSVAAVLFGMK